MPRFLVTIILISLVSLGSLLYIFFRVPPSSELLVYLFIFLLFISLSTILSIPIYAILYNRAERFTDLRKIYRTALRRGSLVSFAIAGMLTLKLLQGLTTLTGVLLLSFLIIFEVFLTKK